MLKGFFKEDSVPGKRNVKFQKASHHKEEVARLDKEAIRKRLESLGYL